MAHLAAARDNDSALLRGLRYLTLRVAQYGSFLRRVATWTGDESCQSLKECNFRHFQVRVILSVLWLVPVESHYLKDSWISP